jgi:hypothetical protein
MTPIVRLSYTHHQLFRLRFACPHSPVFTCCHRDIGLTGRRSSRGCRAGVRNRLREEKNSVCQQRLSKVNELSDDFKEAKPIPTIIGNRLPNQRRSHYESSRDSKNIRSISQGALINIRLEQQTIQSLAVRIGQLNAQSIGNKFVS